MSGNAALASARRRRGEDPTLSQAQVPSKPNTGRQNMQQITNSYGDPNLQVNRQQGIYVHPLQLAREHDKQIFILERKIERLESMGPMENNFSDETQSIIMNNNSELKLLKTALQKQQKATQELNSLITSLKATIMNQNSTIEELTEQVNSVNVVDSSKPTEKNSTLKLDISDK